MGSFSQVETAFILLHFLRFQGKNVSNEKRVGKTVSPVEFPISIFSASQQKIKQCVITESIEPHSFSYYKNEVNFQSSPKNILF